LKGKTLIPTRTITGRTPDYSTPDRQTIQNQGAVIPQKTVLEPNYPNPFNPETVIPFQIAQDGAVRIAVYDITGHLVKTLLNTNLPAGAHSVVWNGADSSGRRVSAGMYFSRLLAGNQMVTRKMLLVR
jgi:hypothetical protein